jgi:hypothetical protein
VMMGYEDSFSRSLGVESVLTGIRTNISGKFRSSSSASPPNEPSFTAVSIV